MVADGDFARDVGADQVSCDGVSGRAEDMDAIARVARDQIARTRGRATDDDARRPPVDLHAVTGVVERGGAGEIGADLVALNRKVPRSGMLDAADENAVPAVARDQVARAGGRAADRVIVRAVDDADAVLEGSGRAPCQWHWCRSSFRESPRRWRCRA